MSTETTTRSLLKTVSWRILATAATALLVLALGGSLELALSVGSMEVIGKLVLYFLHERAWSRISWGLLPAATASGPDSAGPEVNLEPAP